MSLAGRRVRTKYFPDGFATPGTAYTVAKSKVDSGTINVEGIETKTKDDAAWRRYLNDVATKSLDLKVDGVLDPVHKDLIDLAISADTDSALHDFELDFPTIGTFQAQFMLSNFELGGEDNQESTYSCSMSSSGTVTFTPAS